MPERDSTNYFGAGPAPLPTQVLEDAGKALLNYKDMGIGIAEMSHRSPEANQVLADAKAALTQLLGIPDDYEILFMQGGGSGEFSAVVTNMVSIWVEKQRQTISALSEDEQVNELSAIMKKSLRLDYIVTGSWSLKASQEAARLIGSEHVNVAIDARKSNEGKFGLIPSEDQWNLSRLDRNHTIPAFTYFCDNETVDGVEFPAFPRTLEPSAEGERLVVADMSSNFLSRKVDVSKYAVIFGGAQKNIGTPGITIVIMRKSLLPPHSPSPPSTLMRKLGLSVSPIVLDWPTIAKNNSLYNTLPIFDVWIAGQVMSRLVKLHTNIAGQEAESNEKASLIYSTLESFPNLFRIVPHRSARSRMNICLRILPTDTEEKTFLDGAGKKNLLGLKGHRSVGGIRISNCEITTYTMK